VSNERPLITPEISVDLVVFKIVRRVWRVIIFRNVRWVEEDKMFIGMVQKGESKKRV
jgi:hypothetical protein